MSASMRGGRDQARLRLVPLALKEANAFVSAHHRHHPPARGCRFCLGVTLEGSEQLVGVAVVGRPVARMLHDGYTLEVLRLATDGTPNACSSLYGAARRAARSLAYRRILTYTLRSEPGTSLRAAGWRPTGEVEAASWSRASRPRVARAMEAEPKIRWEPVGGVA